MLENEPTNENFMIQYIYVYVCDIINPQMNFFLKKIVYIPNLKLYILGSETIGHGFHFSSVRVNIRTFMLSNEGDRLVQGSSLI